MIYTATPARLVLLVAWIQKSTDETRDKVRELNTRIGRKALKIQTWQDTKSDVSTFKGKVYMAHVEDPQPNAAFQGSRVKRDSFYSCK